MKRGLVIGKFMPLHAGHIALIQFAAAQCDELIVSMSYTAQDPIDPKLRFSWIVRTFSNNPTIRPELSLDDFDDDALPLGKRVLLWRQFIEKRFPSIHLLFSSEEYGEPFANALGVPHVSFDPVRKSFPVSATLIRAKPFDYWSFIPTIVRPFFTKKICFYGPESTGKSYMARMMAEVYQTEFVPEVSREIITTNAFSLDDIIQIGKAQTQRVQEKIITANKVLFCDTDLITTEIYSKIYLNEVPPILYELEEQIHYNLYFLFDIDVPWVADDIRDLGHKRKEMYELFKNELVIRNIPFVSVHGSWNERSAIIKETIQRLFLI